MAQKVGIERPVKKAVSVSKTKLIAPKAASRVVNDIKSKSTTISAGKPVLFQSRINLSDELKAAINKKWDDCWPVSTLRPLALIDLLCYLLFIKKLEEKRLITGSLTRNPGVNTSGNELSWSGFKDLNAQDLHILFTSENGVIDLIKHYGTTNLQYSQFLREPLLLTPSAGLLMNIVDIIKIMDAEGGDKKVAIFGHLLNKAEIEAQSGQVYAPDNFVKLIVELMQPSENDSIWDPSAGNAGFLINCAKYITKRRTRRNGFNDSFFGDNFNGIECDPIQLRIGAMNMILNGIENPRLGGANSFKNAHINICEQSSLVLSNLYFNGAYDRKVIAGKTLLVEAGRSEIHFLNLILNKLANGGRAAVIIPEYILSNFTSEMLAVRQRLVEDHKLSGVISLANKSGSLFSGAAILIFTEMKAGTNDMIWFYKMKASMKKKETGSIHMVENGLQEDSDEYDEMTDIINRWKNLAKEHTRRRTDNSFYVPIDEIKNCNYTLCFNQYRKIEQEVVSYKPASMPVIKREIIKNISTNEKRRLSIPRIKLPEALPDRFRKASLKFTTFVLSVFKGFSFKLTELASSFPKGVSLNFLKRFRPGTTKFSPYLAPLLLIGAISTFFYFEVFRNNNYLPSIVVAKTNKLPPRNKSKEAITTQISSSQAKPVLSQQQIKAIIYDSTTVIHYDGQPAELPNLREDSTKESLSDDIADSTRGSLSEKPDTSKTDNALSIKYAVRDTTFFHNQPDESSIRKSYLDPLNNNILDPIQDKNGFIYIVYTNQSGRTSKGWINKKDLIELR